MKFPLQKLNQAGDEPFVFEDDVDIRELENMNNDIRRIPPVHVQGQARRRGDDISVTFSIEGEMVLPCARTLVDVDYPFHIEAREEFNLSPYYEKEDDSEIHPISGEMLDLTPYIKENVILEVPTRVFSDDEEAHDQALTEGKGWQVVTEEPEEKKVDPRMAKLQSLLNEEENNE
ncbi:YceD family protein [Halobacillus amylolyticus]|uniref:YceD family protein n=1 Tax=Halobacillus amylolyticus TaxID=2932259 RepID=A0ABY4HDK8_9BACI|nr:YceD family protein [Halobacillus amylolyticus]UOR12937.1 YceD family protein [Halobacillus amylolyticus]